MLAAIQLTKGKKLAHRSKPWQAQPYTLSPDPWILGCRGRHVRMHPYTTPCSPQRGPVHSKPQPLSRCQVACQRKIWTHFLGFSESPKSLNSRSTIGSFKGLLGDIYCIYHGDTRTTHMYIPFTRILTEMSRRA